MKLIRAIIQPRRLESVRDALQAEGIAGMTIYEAQGFGRQKGHGLIYRGAEYTVTFRPKVAVEVLVSDADLEPACRAIGEAARTGNTGDGKIFVMDLERAIGIRTGERDACAV